MAILLSLLPNEIHVYKDLESKMYILRFTVAIA